MARSHSSYTASPARHRSPQHSPARRPPSEDGSQYEVDLDALGLNSSFDSAGLDDAHAPKIDVVDTSDIGGPEDFTMNMTYWMTADLPLSQIKSRKETNARTGEVRGDARKSAPVQDVTEEGDRAVIEDTTRDRGASEDFNSASPTMRANGTADGEDENVSEASMENEEKVMSYLSALPDTELPGAITSTPLKITKGNMLQVPAPAGSKTRLLQATVEDYETPRKPTQETVIHHVPAQQAATDSGSIDYNAFQEQVAELQARLDQQELTSKTRITELETILSYTRTELDAARTAQSKQKEEISALKDAQGAGSQRHESDSEGLAAQLEQKEQEMEARIQEFGEELRLQNLSKLQSQREDFERQITAVQESKKAAEEEAHRKDQVLEQLRTELSQLRQSHEKEIQEVQGANAKEQAGHDQKATEERDSLNEKLSTLQSRAESLQTALEEATRDARSARQEADIAREEARTTLAAHSSDENQTSRIVDLETQTRSLHSQLDALRAELASKDRKALSNVEEQERLEQRLAAAEGRNEGLETTISTLRQQLVDAYRQSSKDRADIERLENDLEAWSDRLDDARKEADRRVADVERKLNKMKELKADAESRARDLQSENENLIEDHASQLEDVRAKTEDAVRKVGAMLEAERSEKRRLTKELRKTTEQLQKLRVEHANKIAEERDSEDDDSSIHSYSSSREAEVENLRALVRSQATELKGLKSEISSLRKKSQLSATLQSELETLRAENAQLHSSLASQRAEFEATNKAMDERLAATLSRFLKERSKAIVGKRDDQWVESAGKLKAEKEFMGKVLMREWGRQECGVKEEMEKQLYCYQYVKRA